MNLELFSFHMISLKYKKRYYLYIISAVLLCYHATLSYPWHFDDTPNILDNPKIQISSLSISSLSDSLHAAPQTSKISRPVSFLSLAINWYFGQENTFGYHLVNILIHLFVSIALFKTIIILFSTPKLSDIFSHKDTFSIAVLSSLLWAIHPIQTQAVTYIVQRMASMAALFFLLGIYYFLKFKVENSSYFKKYFYLALILVFYILAIGSKENTIILPISLLLIDFAFFDKKKCKIENSVRYFLIFVSSLLVISGLFYSVSIIASNSFFDPYGVRSFSLFERLINQPKILFFYLSLLFYPLPERFSITHDVHISHSLFSDPTTFSSLFLLALLIVLSFLGSKKYPIVFFPLLFYLINHSVESSIIPLELIFEHRNYLPSLFLFVPLSFLLVKGLSFYNKRNKVVFACICCFITGIIFLLGWGTYLRNNIWSSHETLWVDANRKAPNHARPLSYLGQVYGWEKGKTPENINKALDFYHKAIDKYHPSKAFRNHLFGNIAGIYFNNKLYQDAAKYYQIAVNNDSTLDNFRYGLAQVLMLLGKSSESLNHINFIISESNNKYQIARAYRLKGLLLLWDKEPYLAISNYRNALRMSSRKSDIYYDIGVAYAHVGDYQKASWFVKNANAYFPDNINIFFSLIEINLLSKDRLDAQKYTDTLIDTFSLKKIRDTLYTHDLEKLRSVPINNELIEPFIMSRYLQRLSSNQLQQ